MANDTDVLVDVLAPGNASNSNVLADQAIGVGAPGPAEDYADVDLADYSGVAQAADSAFFDGVQRGIDQGQALMYATSNAIGEVTGFDALAEFGAEGYHEQMVEAAQNPRHVEMFDDIDSLSTLGKYISESVGEQMFNIATMALGGGAGVKLTQAAIGKAAIANMSKHAAKKLTSKAARVGAGVPSYGMGAGEVQGEFLDEGINAPGLALLAGIPIAGLDVFGLERALKGAMGGMPVSSARQLVERTARAFGVGAAGEMPTEAAQELIAMTARHVADPTYEVFTEENMMRLADAGIKGGLVGGISAGSGNAVLGGVQLLQDNVANARELAREAINPQLPSPEDQGPSTPPEGPSPTLPGPAQELQDIVDDTGGGPTVKEDTDTLQAGVDAIGRGGRKAAYSADPNGFDAVVSDGDFSLVPAADGGVYYVRPADVAEVQQLDRDGKQSEILGYPSDKPEGADTIVQARDAQGRVVQDVVTDDVKAAKAQGKEAAGPGGTVHEMAADVALASRVERLGQAKVDEAIRQSDVSELKNFVQSTAQQGDPNGWVNRAKWDASDVNGFEDYADVSDAQALGQDLKDVKPNRIPFVEKSVEERARYIPDLQAATSGAVFLDAPRDPVTTKNDLRAVGKGITARLVKKGMSQTEAVLESNRVLSAAIKNVPVAQAILDELSKEFGVNRILLGVMGSLPGTSGIAMPEAGLIALDVQTLINLSKGDTKSFRKSLEAAKSVEIIFHEFAHTLQATVLRNASIEQKASVFQAYDEYLAQAQKQDSFSTELMRMPPALKLRALDASVGLNRAIRPELDQYVLSAAEWWANEVAKYIVDKKITGTDPVFKSFTKSMGDILRRVYRKLAQLLRKNNAPVPSIKEFMDSHLAYLKENGGQQMYSSMEQAEETNTTVAKEDMGDDATNRKRNEDGTPEVAPEDLVGALLDEVVEQEPVTTTVKNSTAARIVSKIYGGKAKPNKDGTRDVTVSGQAPRVTQSDPAATHPLAIKAVAKVFDDGITEERGRIEVSNPYPTEKNKAAGKETNAKVSLPALMRLGRQLNMLNDVATDPKSNLLSGLAWLYENNFIPVSVREKHNGGYRDRKLNISNGKETRLGLPLTTIVDGHEKFGTTVTFKDVMYSDKNKGELAAKLTKIEKKAQELEEQVEAEAKAIEDLSTEADKLSEQLMVGQKGPNKLAPAELKAIATKIRALHAELKSLRKSMGPSNKLLWEARDAFNALRDRAKHSGITMTDGQFDYREIEQEAGQQQDEDTRRFPTDDEQARDSARDTTPKTKRVPPRYAAQRNNKVMASATFSQKLANMAGAILKLLGMQNQVIMVNEEGVSEYLKDIEKTMAMSEIDAEYKAVLQKKHDLIVSQMEKGGDGWVIFNSEFKTAEDRVPMVYVSSKGKTTHQMTVMTHELGHLVQRVVFDQAPKNVQKAIMDSMSNIKASRSNTFEENFANMLRRYLLDLDSDVQKVKEGDYAMRKLRSIARQVNPTAEQKKQDAANDAEYKRFQLVDRFFKKLAGKIRKLWQKARGTYKVDEEYKEFVDAMVGAATERAGRKPITRLGNKHRQVIDEILMGPYMPYMPEAGTSADWSAADVRAFAASAVRNRRAKSLVRNTGAAAQKTWNLAHDKVLGSADAVLRTMGPRMVALADQFHHRPGEKKTGRTFFEEIRYHMGQRQAKLDELVRGLPMRPSKARGWWHRPVIDETSGEYVQLMEMLRTGVTETEFGNIGGTVGTAGVRVRKFLEEQRVWLESMGVAVKKRANYFPSVADIHQWTTKQPEIIAVFQRHGYSIDQAQKVIDTMIDNDGLLEDTYEHDDSLLGPSFKFMKQRKLTQQLTEDLQPFMLQDLQGIMQFYTKSAVERGVTTRRWALSHNEKSQLQNEFNTLGIGQHLNSPVAKLHLELMRARAEGMTKEQFNVVKNKILEAYFGRLGANIDPRWQKFQSMAIAYQNIRLLSFAVLTSLVDAGQIGWRAESATASLKALGRMFDRADREAQYEMARLIGAIEDNVTDHVLNDQTTTKFMSPKAKQWNEKFFRMIGMHQWTNMTRVMAMTAGVDFMDRHADLAAAGDATSIKHLEELGVTAQDIYDWQDAGRPTNDLTEADSHSRVISALNTFIDEAIVRPDATVRPGWASDRNWQIMFHLKSFMWGYQETLLMRIWLRAKAEPTVMKSLQSGGLSAALLVAMTLPLAVAGYELRRLLSWWGNPPEQSKKRGWDYVQEVIERAGYLGLIQFVADAEQAQEFGRLSLLSAAGPSLTQLEEFITDDWASIATRATPVLAQTGAGRKIVRDWLRGD